MSGQSISELFMNNIEVLPFWVKQIIYLKTGDKLKDKLPEFMNIVLTHNIIQYYTPKLTFAGRNELTTHEKHLPDEFYTFLRASEEQNDLFEVTISNYWTFAQTCGIFCKCIELEFLHLPENESVVAVAQFIAGKIRTGEVLKRLNKIDIMQLENSLRIQKERAEAGTPIKMAELMIELGYITKFDVDALLALKEDAKKRFVMGVGFSFVKPKNEQELQSLFRALQKEIKRLDEENRLLKSRLRKILNIKE